jgi:hypothetical protein
LSVPVDRNVNFVDQGDILDKSIPPTTNIDNAYRKIGQLMQTPGINDNRAVVKSPAKDALSEDDTGYRLDSSDATGIGILSQHSEDRSRSKQIKMPKRKYGLLQQFPDPEDKTATANASLE